MSLFVFHKLNSECSVFSVVPLNFRIQVDGPRTLSFSWEHPVGYERTGDITAYWLSCDPLPDGFPKLYNSQAFTEQGVMVTESGFTPSTTYNCSVLASSEAGDNLPTSATATTLDYSMSVHVCVWCVCVCVCAPLFTSTSHQIQHFWFSCRSLMFLTVGSG